MTCLGVGVGAFSSVYHVLFPIALYIILRRGMEMVRVTLEHHLEVLQHFLSNPDVVIAMPRVSEQVNHL